MKPGRELDAKIAEIMGYKVHMGGDVLKPEYQYPIIYDNEADHYIDLPFYSTNISDAWLLRAWLLDNVGGVKLERVCHHKYPELCEVWTKEGPIRVQAKTTPLAICLATLKACGVKITS